MTASVTAHPPPAASSALNTPNLAIHPPSGGMPASEKRKNDMVTASPGAYSKSPP
jgi:hypothetical protein